MIKKEKKKIIKIDRESIGKRAIEWRDRSSLKERRRRPVNQGKPWSIITCIATAVLAVSWSEPIRARTAYLLQRFRVSVILRVEPTIRLRAYWIILRAKRMLLFSLSLTVQYKYWRTFYHKLSTSINKKKKKRHRMWKLSITLPYSNARTFLSFAFHYFFEASKDPDLTVKRGEEVYVNSFPQSYLSCLSIMYGA